MRQVKFLFITGAAVLALSCTAKDADVPSTKVEKGDVEQIVALSGSVKPLRETMILAPYSGYVRRLYVKVGQIVKREDPLVAFSTSLLEDQQFPIRAAYPGLVSQVLKSEGDYVTQGGNEGRILKYEDRSRMFVESDVPEAEITKIKIDQSAKVRVNAFQGREFDGKIVQIFQSARESENSWDRKGGAFPIRIEILDPTPEVQTGLTGTVEIRVAERKGVLRLPQEYLKKEGGVLMVVRMSDRKSVEIKTGLKSESYVEILSGLKEGEEVLYPINEKAEQDD